MVDEMVAWAVLGRRIVVVRVAEGGGGRGGEAAGIVRRRWIH